MPVNPMTFKDAAEFVRSRRENLEKVQQEIVDQILTLFNEKMLTLMQERLDKDINLNMETAEFPIALRSGGSPVRIGGLSRLGQMRLVAALNEAGWQVTNGIAADPNDNSVNFKVRHLVAPTTQPVPRS